MACTHHLLKCVNCVWYCQICGARVDKPKPAKPAKPAEAATGAKEAVTEAAEQPKKRRTRKGATKE